MFFFKLFHSVFFLSQKPALLLHHKLLAVLDVNAFGQVAHVHAAALEVIDAVVGSEAVGGGDSLHASDNGLIGFLARVDIEDVYKRQRV